MKNNIENRILKRDFSRDNVETLSIKNDEKINQKISHKLFEDLDSDQPKKKCPRNDFMETDSKNKKDQCYSDNKKKYQKNEIVKVKLNHDEISKKSKVLYKTILHSKIIQFLNNNIAKECLREYYIKKMAEILSNYDFLIIQKANYLRYTSIFEPYNFGFTIILNSALSNFGKDIKFDYEQYKKFNDQLFGQLNLIRGMIEFRTELRNLDTEVQKFLYYAELTKLSKYFSEIPELMILDGVFDKPYFDLQLISIHFIKFLLEKKKIEEVKVFVLFLIKKIFDLSKRRNLDFFSNFEFTTDCLVNKNILHYFGFYFILYEMSPAKRIDFKRKVNKQRKQYEFKENDNTHIKSVIIVFLYQQLIFMELNNVKEADMEKFMIFIDKYIDKDFGCSVCEIYKFIAILRNLLI
jgi:hypothetical protein